MQEQNGIRRMVSHSKDCLGVMMIVATVIAVGMLASLTEPLVATGLFGFSGVGAAMLVPMSIHYPEQDQ